MYDRKHLTNILLGLPPGPPLCLVSQTRNENRSHENSVTETTAVASQQLKWQTIHKRTIMVA